MSNYTIDNLIPATAGEGRIPAIKIGSQVFPMQVSGGGGGGSTDLYKCASVSGPYTETYYVVASAGMAAVNGNYTDTGTTSGGKPVYSYTNSGTTYYLFYDSGWESWFIHTSTTFSDMATDECLFYKSNYEESWYTGGGGSGDPPTVTPTTVSHNLPKTWTGYKAVLDPVTGVYGFEASVTSGLTWSNVFRPLVGNIYNNGATVQATIPQILLLAHLDQNLDIEGGGSMTEVGTITYSAGKSGYAASVDQDNYINTGITTTSLQGDFTIDFWVKIPDTTTRFAPLAGYTDGKIGIDSYRGYWNIWAGNNGWNILQADNAGYDDSGNGSIACTTDWTHIAYVHSGNDWYLFVNGQLSVHKVRQGDVTGNVDVCIGRWGGGGFSSTPILIDELRICNKALWTAAFTPPSA